MSAIASFLTGLVGRRSRFGLRAVRRSVASQSLVLSLLMGSMSLGVSRVSAADEIDLPTIRAALDFYTSSVKTLEGRYSLSAQLEPGFEYGPHVLVMEDLRREIGFAADLERGWTSLDETKSWLYSGISKEKRFEVRTVESFDGNRYHALLYTVTKSPIPTKVPFRVPHQLNMFSHDETRIDYGPWSFAGLRLKRFEVSLAALLQTSAARLDGRETLDGSECYRVVAERDGIRFIAWLDPQHDFLPRRQQYIDLTKAEESNPPLYLLENTEFRQFTDDAHGTRRWFPVRGKARDFTREIKTIEVAELRINVPLKRSQFQIDPETLPDGVEINDASQSPMQVSYTGGRVDLWNERQRLVDQQTDKMAEILGIDMRPPSTRPSGTHGTVRAEPPRQAQWRVWLLAAGSVILIAVGARKILHARNDH